MTVAEIIIKYLEDNGFDGLFADNECACSLDEIMPCSNEIPAKCEPGYIQPCDCGEHGFHIRKEKPEGTIQQQEPEPLE